MCAAATSLGPWPTNAAATPPHRSALAGNGLAKPLNQQGLGKDGQPKKDPAASGAPRRKKWSL